MYIKIGQCAAAEHDAGGYRKPQRLFSEVPVMDAEREYKADAVNPPVGGEGKAAKPKYAQYFGAAGLEAVIGPKGQQTEHERVNGIEIEVRATVWERACFV